MANGDGGPATKRQRIGWLDRLGAFRNLFFRRSQADEVIKSLLLNEYSLDSKDHVTRHTLESLQFLKDNKHTKQCELLREDSLETVELLRDDSFEMVDTTTLLARKIPEEKYSEWSKQLFGLSIRPSRLYIERPCYPRLFEVLIKSWEEQEDKNILVSGNAGVGKSWFQVYFLQRLLIDRYNGEKKLVPSVRFILRQFKRSFFLIDLDTGGAWNIKGQNAVEPTAPRVSVLVERFKNVLYLFEPSDDQNIPPLWVAGKPSLLTLPPNPQRVKGYLKCANDSAIVFYMPTWSFADLEAVKKSEHDVKKWEGYDFEISYHLFGGIIRRTLVYSEATFELWKTELDNKIETVDTNVLRAMHVDLDDNSSGQTQNNISGYICSYDEIEEEGETAFRKPILSMTSQFASDGVRRKLGYLRVVDHVRQLLACINNQAQDISGMALEVSAVNLVQIGPSKVKWEYEEVGKQEKPLELQHTKTDIDRRDEDFDFSKICYPSKLSFPLIDFFIKLKGGTIWGFQTTWQKDHPFKLKTLWSLRQTLRIDETHQLNILYVLANKDKLESYLNRAKDKYLEKGENWKQAICDKKRNEILSAEKVERMWENTKVFVCYPKDKNWHAALENWLKDDDRARAAKAKVTAEADPNVRTS